MQDISISTVAVVIQVLLYASVAYIVLKRLKFPYTIGLVLIGMPVWRRASRVTPSFTPASVLCTASGPWARPKSAV